MVGRGAQAPAGPIQRPFRRPASNDGCLCPTQRCRARRSAAEPPARMDSWRQLGSDLRTPRAANSRRAVPGHELNGRVPRDGRYSTFDVTPANEQGSPEAETEGADTGHRSRLGLEAFREGHFVTPIAMLRQMPHGIRLCVDLHHFLRHCPKLYAGWNPERHCASWDFRPRGDDGAGSHERAERQVTPSRTTAPEPTRTRSSRWQPSRCARWPITQSDPILVRFMDWVWMTVPSWMEVRSPMVIGPLSARMMTPGRTLRIRSDADLADQNRLRVDIGLGVNPRPVVAQCIESHGDHSNSAAHAPGPQPRRPGEAWETSMTKRPARSVDWSIASPVH